MIKYSFCPKCGSPLEDKNGYYKCTSCGYNLFPHSSATGSVLIIKEDKVLLSKRKIDPNKGQIDMPGGFLNYSENPQDGALREIKEEIGQEIEIIDLLGIYMDSYFYQNEDISTLNMVYIGQLKSPTVKIEVSDDVAEVFWQPIDEVPEKVAFNVIKQALEDLKKWHETGRGRRN